MLVCPLDLSGEAESVLPRAIELARALGAEIQLLHVYQPSAFALPKEGETLDYIERLIHDAQAYLDGVRARLLEREVRVSTCLLEGEPPHQIVGHAKRTPGCMLVMATHGRSGFRRLVLGSVTERVVRNASVPVLVIQAGSESERQGQ
jgi:nucleotide-binding universal stress UspA family protein